MALWVNEGFLDKTQIALGQATAPQYQISLYVNPITPGLGSTLADFVECTLPGYAAVALAPSNWTISVAAGQVTATYPVIAWNFAANPGSTTVFGYFVQNVKTGKLAWAEAFSTPFAVPAGGGSVTVAQTWYDQNA